MRALGILLIAVGVLVLVAAFAIVFAGQGSWLRRDLADLVAYAGAWGCGLMVLSGTTTMLRVWWLFHPRYLVPAATIGVFGYVAAPSLLQAKDGMVVLFGVAIGLLAWWAAWFIQRKSQ